VQDEPSPCRRRSLLVVKFMVDVLVGDRARVKVNAVRVRVRVSVSIRVELGQRSK